MVDIRRKCWGKTQWLWTSVFKGL